MKAVAAVLVSSALVGGAWAQTSTKPMSRHTTASSEGTMAQSDAKRDAAVEKHIEELHTSLKITAAQEAQWSDVANTMRENVKEMDRVIDKRMATAASATAIDDLKAYGEIAQAHANGIKKLATSFSGLYSAMSDDQKKAADAAFSHHGGHDGKKVASR